MANWSNTKGNHSHNVGLARDRTKIRIRNSLQLAGRIGWACACFMPYGKLGWSNAKSSYSSTSASNRDSKRINGLLYGAGIDVLAYATQTISTLVGLEYTGVNYGKHQHLTSSDGSRIRIRPVTNKFAVTAKFIY